MANKKQRLEPQPPCDPDEGIKMPQDEADAAVPCIQEHTVDSLVISIEKYDVKDTDFDAGENGKTSSHIHAMAIREDEIPC